MTLADPFNPNGGEFAKNIRTITGLDDTELRKSLKQFGWLKELPAIMDENDVVLVGHRRLRLAKQLNIEPVINRIRLGKGAEADAYRLKLAIASNIGGQPLTRDDRKRIAGYLYGKREWTMEKIAKALDVNQSTITRDLGNLCTPHKLKPTRTASNPKGAGRPKSGGGGKGKSRGAPRRHYKEDDIVRLSDAGQTTAQIHGETGIGRRQVRHILEREQARRAAVAEAEPKITRDMLSMSAQQKYDAAIRQTTRKLEVEIEQRIRDEYQKWMTDLLTDYRKKEEHYNLIVKQHKGVMDRATYKLIWSCLHSDSRNSVSDDRLNRAFNIWSNLEKVIVSAKESETKYSDLPQTTEELLKRKAEYQARKAAERAAKKAASNGGVERR